MVIRGSHTRFRWHLKAITVLWDPRNLSFGITRGIEREEPVHSWFLIKMLPVNKEDNNSIALSSQVHKKLNEKDITCESRDVWLNDRQETYRI